MATHFITFSVFATAVKLSSMPQCIYVINIFRQILSSSFYCANLRKVGYYKIFVWPILELWASICETFLNLPAKALWMAPHCITKYLCEAGLSIVVTMNTKLRGLLDIGPGEVGFLEKHLRGINVWQRKNQEH